MGISKKDIDLLSWAVDEAGAWAGGQPSRSEQEAWREKTAAARKVLSALRKMHKAETSSKQDKHAADCKRDRDLANDILDGALS